MWQQRETCVLLVVLIASSPGYLVAPSCLLGRQLICQQGHDLAHGRHTAGRNELVVNHQARGRQDVVSGVLFEISGLNEGGFDAKLLDGCFGVLLKSRTVGSTAAEDLDVECHVFFSKCDHGLRKY